MSTCTAPGHSSCTITCSNGCIALYSEPNGPCTTSCTGGARLEIDPTAKYSVQISDIAPSDLDNILGATFAGTLHVQQAPAAGKISLSLNGASKQDILDAIHGAI